MQEIVDPAWMAVAKAEIGVKEVAGSGNNPRILEYHSATTLNAKMDEVAWCAAFVNWVLKQVGIQGTDVAAARAFLSWGEEISEPEYGCIVVLKRGKQAWQGHVGFVVGEKAHTIMVLGGNQADSVCIREYPKSDVLGYRRVV